MISSPPLPFEVHAAPSEDSKFYSGDGVARGVSCVTGKKGSGLWGGSAIALVSVIKNESAPLSVLLTSLPSSSSCKFSCCKYCSESSFSFSIQLGNF